MSTAYPTEFKVKTIRRYEKGESIKALSQELHISQSILCRLAQRILLDQNIHPHGTVFEALYQFLCRCVEWIGHFLRRCEPSSRSPGLTHIWSRIKSEKQGRPLDFSRNRGALGRTNILDAAVFEAAASVIDRMKRLKLVCSFGLNRLYSG